MLIEVGKELKSLPLLTEVIEKRSNKETLEDLLERGVIEKFPHLDFYMNLINLFLFLNLNLLIKLLFPFL